MWFESDKLLWTILDEKLILHKVPQRPRILAILTQMFDRTKVKSKHTSSAIK
jgi:hypothetical protein